MISQPWLLSSYGCLDASGLELCPTPQLLMWDTLENVKRLTSEWKLGQCEGTYKWGRDYNECTCECYVPHGENIKENSA